MSLYHWRKPYRHKLVSRQIIDEISLSVCRCKRQRTNHRRFYQLVAGRTETLPHLRSGGGLHSDADPVSRLRCSICTEVRNISSICLTLTYNCTTCTCTCDMSSGIHASAVLSLRRAIITWLIWLKQSTSTAAQGQSVTGNGCVYVRGLWYVVLHNKRALNLK